MAYAVPDFIKFFFISLLAVVLLNWHFYQVRLFFAYLGIFWSIPNFCWFLSRLFYRWSRKTYISPVKKAVLVTGCDTGFGHLAAKILDQYGFYVFAGCLSPNGVGAQKLYMSSSKRLRILHLDVTKHEDIQAAVKEIEECDLELWAVVNNAEMIECGFLEWGDIVGRMNKILDVNFFGAVKITTACLPLLRKSHGRVVFVSSILGRISLQSCGPYTVSKHATKAFADTLKVELTRHGVKTITIEPAFYLTDLSNYESLSKSLDETWQASTPEVKSVYTETSKNKMLKGYLKFTTYFRKEVYDVPLAIEEAVTVSNPLGVYTCAGFFDKIALWLAYKFPDDLDILLMTNALSWFNLLFAWGK